MRSSPPASVTSSVANRTHARAVALAEKLGGRADRARRPSRRAHLGRRAAHLHRLERGAHRAGRRRGGDGAPRAARRCSSSTSPCRATSTPASPRSRASPSSTSTTCMQLTEAALDERRREIGKVREIIGEELERFQTERAAREVAPLVVGAAGPRRGAADRRARALPRQARRPRPRRARRRRGAHPGHRQQAAPRADRAAQGRGRHRARRALRRRARVRCSTSADVRRMTATAPRRHARQRVGALAGRARRRAARRRPRSCVDRLAPRATVTAPTRSHAIGGTGVFVKEVQEAVLDGDADLAVHSAKDLPAVDTPTGSCSPRCPERADARDALVGARARRRSRPGARVATGSVRRRAQLAAVRPDLTLRRAARQHRRRGVERGRASSTPSSSRSRRSSGSGSPTASPSGSTRR